MKIRHALAIALLMYVIGATLVTLCVTCDRSHSQKGFPVFE
jgi:hypothetical protein